MRSVRDIISYIRTGLGRQDTIIIAGSVLTVIAATVGGVILPMCTMRQRPSDIWLPITQREEQGREVYIANGCTYCHSQYIRTMDWDIGAERISREGDYYNQKPHLLGSERTGPDLSHEGGEHPGDWHLAHFANPRYTSPRSLMPRFAYLGKNDIDLLTAYVQSLGGKMASAKVDIQDRFKREALTAWGKGPDANIAWLHARVPPEWRLVMSESPATEASVARGEKVYQDYCIGCHGPVGDGNGPAAPYLKPAPVNFTLLRRHLIDGKYIGGILYYQIMNGVTGSAMPYFKKHLESAKIWDVGNYVMINYINWDDSRLPTDGIPAAYEGQHAAPVTKSPQPGPIPPGQGAAK